MYQSNEPFILIKKKYTLEIKKFKYFLLTILCVIEFYENFESNK